MKVVLITILDFIPKLSLSELSSDDNEDEMNGSCGIYGGEERCRYILHSTTDHLNNFVTSHVMQIITDQKATYKTFEYLSLPVRYAM